MAKKGVGHILLVEADGRLCGLVHQADLLGLRAGGAEMLIAAIAATRDLKAMVLVADQVRRRGAELFHAGMGVEALCQWMSGLNDLIAMRVIETHGGRIRPARRSPGAGSCSVPRAAWSRPSPPIRTMASSSAQPDAGDTEALRAAFLPFAQAVNDALHYCGFERCRGKHHGR